MINRPGGAVSEAPLIDDSKLRQISSASTQLLEALRARDYRAAHKALDIGANPNAIYRYDDGRKPSRGHPYPVGTTTQVSELRRVCVPALCVALSAAHGALGDGAMPAEHPKSKSMFARGLEKEALAKLIVRMIKAGADPHAAGSEVDGDGSGGCVFG